MQGSRKSLTGTLLKDWVENAGGALGKSSVQGWRDETLVSLASLIEIGDQCDQCRQS